MKKRNTLHLVGNAHLDPVWLWRMGDGLAEIKATFRSALDRIREFEDFVFTSACASYYKWVEENAPEMFEEIRAAVKAGRWSIVGGMWVQPDCNMPSTESIVRHFLYSQRYFYEKFGVIAKTGYNVDSFGHSGALPSLLRGAGIENYIFMRPAPKWGEMEYPFSGNAFRWRRGEDEVAAFRLNVYCKDIKDDTIPAEYDALCEASDGDFMLFYGVGNHGGGPTIRNVEALLSYGEGAKSEFRFSSPDGYFDAIRKSGAYDRLPIYEGELQNHASGCYAANSRVKRENRRAESLLFEAEVLSAMAAATLTKANNADILRHAWQVLLFHQFHDVLCGCCVRSAHEDASMFLGGAAADGLSVMTAAAQRISYAVDTLRGVRAVSREKVEQRGIPILLEQGELGAPIVVVNPLSHAVRVPVSVRTDYVTGVTDEKDAPIAYQLVHSDYTVNHGARRMAEYRSLRFMAELPPLGWRTYWVHAHREYPMPPTAKMTAGPHTLSNGRLTLHLDPVNGGIASVMLLDRQLLADRVSVYVIDDAGNDTWAHGKFVFDQTIGEFQGTDFCVLEDGPCQVSVRSRRYYKNSLYEEIYTLYEGDDRLYVEGRIILNEPLVRVALCFDSGLGAPEWVREIPGGHILAQPNGREMPMLRYTVLRQAGQGIALINDSKYSCAADGGVLRMTVARSCYYADHQGPRHERLPYQDIGEQTFSYVLMAAGKSLTPIIRTAEELHTDFVTVPETYHEGPLAMCDSLFSCDAENITVVALKEAEEGGAQILRLAETEGQRVEAGCMLCGVRFEVSLSPYELKSYRIENGKATPCDLIERPIG